jgi:hypothetical protein
MATRRLRWQGTTRTEQCRQALLGRVRAWLVEWSAGALPAFDLRTVDAAALAAAAWHAAARSGAQVWIGVGGDGIAALGATLAGLPAPDRRQLGAGLGRRAVDDLLARLLPPGATPDPVAIAPDADDAAARFGSLVFAGSGALAGVVICADAGACDAWVAPTPVATGSALTARAAAATGEAVPLEVVLGLGDVALADASGLRVGEVLLAGSLRDLAVTLRTPSGPALMTGALTRAGDRLAISLRQRTA